MSAFSVTSIKLREAAEEINRLNGQFMNTREELVTAESALKTMWEGAANEAFHAAFTRDTGQMEAFYSEMTRYAQALETIAVKYEEAERRNEQLSSARSY